MRKATRTDAGTEHTSATGPGSSGVRREGTAGDTIIAEPGNRRRVLKNRPSLATLSQTHAVHAIPPYVSILIFLFHLLLGLYTDVFPSGCPLTFLHAFFCLLLLNQMKRRG